MSVPSYDQAEQKDEHRYEAEHHHGDGIGPKDPYGAIFKTGPPQKDHHHDREHHAEQAPEQPEYPGTEQGNCRVERQQAKGPDEETSKKKDGDASAHGSGFRPDTGPFNQQHNHFHGSGECGKEIPPPSVIVDQRLLVLEQFYLPLRSVEFLNVCDTFPWLLEE